MRRALSILARLLTAAAIVLMLIASATEGLAGLWGGLCVLLAVLCGFLEDRMKRQDNQKKPVTAVEATVLSHRTVRERVGRSNYVINYYVCFRTAEGKRLEFQVSELDYDDFDVDETGPLRYRGWEFLSFGVRDKSAVKPIAPLPEEYDLPREQKRGTAPWRRTMTDKRRAAPEKRDGRAVPEQTASGKNDGILTHELDE